MKRPLTMAVAAGLLAAGAGSAMAQISGNVTFVTDYIWRGQSQTSNDPAIQGGLTFAHDSGFYAGIWGSNVDFDNGAGDSVTLELDFSLGYSGKISEPFGYDVGFVYYYYPTGDSFGADPVTGVPLDLNYYEIYGKLTYDFGPAALTGGIYYSPEFYLESGTGLFYFAEVSVPLPQEFGLKFHIGHQSVDDNKSVEIGGPGASNVFQYGRWGTPDWTEWSVGVTKSIAGLDLALSYTDTNLDENECFGVQSPAGVPVVGSPATDLCDGTVVFSVGKSF